MVARPFTVEVPLSEAAFRMLARLADYETRRAVDVLAEVVEDGLGRRFLDANAASSSWDRFYRALWDAAGGGRPVATLQPTLTTARFRARDVARWIADGKLSPPPGLEHLDVEQLAKTLGEEFRRQTTHPTARSIWVHSGGIHRTGVQLWALRQNGPRP